MTKFLLMCCLALLAFGCAKNSGNDACATVTCQNGGICESGDCYCPDGYTGEYCEMIIVQDPCATLQCYNGGSCVNGGCLCPEMYYGSNCQYQYDGIIDCATDIPYEPLNCPAGYIGPSCTSLIEDVIIGKLPDRVSMDYFFPLSAKAEIFRGAQSNEFFFQVPAFSADSILVQRNVLGLTIASQPYKGDTINGQGTLMITNMSVYINLQFEYGGTARSETFRKEANIP